MARSHSSLTEAGVTQKLREALTFLRWKLFTRGGNPDVFSEFFAQIQGAGDIYSRFTGRAMQAARVLEIGFGARPNRLIALMSMGVDARGIDLDQPMLNFSITRLVQILRKNGMERALKSAGRSLLFDRTDRRLLRLALQQRGYELRIDAARFLVGDAATFRFASLPFDLIFSERVFEHIPQQDLEQLVARLPSLLSPHGIAIITVDVYTGIIGGHLPEWYAFQVNQTRPKPSEPWEHLRKGRFIANAYLNKLSLADYRKLFAADSEILEENVIFPDLGRQWLTPEVRHELAQWSDEELFSNRVQFVLRPRHKN